MVIGYHMAGREMLFSKKLASIIEVKARRSGCIDYHIYLDEHNLMEPLSFMGLRRSKRAISAISEDLESHRYYKQR
jgi:hypothetical protein